MTIMRIESVIYGVEDLAASTRFFNDVGIEQVQSDATHTLFRTPVNQQLELRKLDDPLLPRAVYSGSGVREIIWGVDNERGLAEIRNELAKDRALIIDADGTTHTLDMTGYGIGFRVTNPIMPTDSVRDYNTPSRMNRINKRLNTHGRARPLQMIHIAMDIPDQDHQAANNFYTERLKFKVTDDVLPVGKFMQCEGNMQHHNLLLCHRTNDRSTNHLAFEVSDFDEVIEGGNFMTEQGWKESRRLGRHTAGSNVFRFFHSPAGGRIEIAHDMDRMDKNWKTQVWEKAPPHHLWMVKFPGDVERSHVPAETGVTE